MPQGSLLSDHGQDAAGNLSELLEINIHTMVAPEIPRWLAPLLGVVAARISELHYVGF